MAHPDPPQRRPDVVDRDDKCSARAALSLICEPAEEEPSSDTIAVEEPEQPIDE